MDGDDIATCIGIHTVITTKKFVFNLVYMDQFLAALAPADTVFQSHEIGYNRAMNVIEAVKTSVADYRTDYFPDKCDEILAMAHHLTEPQPTDAPQPPTDTPRPTRDRRRSTLLRGFVIEESIGERSDEYDEIRSCFYEVIDVTLAEFNRRFTENNEILSALSNSPNMEFDELKPLEKLGVALPPVHEMQTAKNYIENKRKETTMVTGTDKNKKRFNILSSLYEVKEVFPEVYKLYALIDTFACSTATCEASFSALSQINIPSRVSMTNQRMRNLAFITFEHNRLNNICIDDVLKAFDSKKQRRVQLF